MNGTPRDAQAPGHRECLLSSVARTPSVTQVVPAKKITFLKRGDPQFAGVRLAVHRRAFRSFGALMDELSQRVPLSFGVRSVTTPRGLHGLSTLEQLQDGGCYLCSDKKPPKTPSGPGRPRGRSPSQPSRDFEGCCEAPGTASSCKSLGAPRRITLVKNGDPRYQQTVVLSHRNTRSLTAFLSKASDLLRFPVKRVYTPGGKQVDSLKGLLHSPSMLVCAGHEPFRPLAVEDVRRNGSEPLPGQISRSKSGSWEPRAKPSVIHARSRPGSRPRQLSLLSGRSGLSDPSLPLHRACTCPAPEKHPRDTPAQLSPLAASEDVEKNVRVNEDGSLSVEMRVRFHVLGEELLLWSRRVGRASGLTAASGEGPVLGEADPLGCVRRGPPRDPSEPGAQGLGPREAGGVGAFDRGRWQLGSRYEIWMNPLYAPQGEQTASQRRSGLTPKSHSGTPRSQGAASRKSRSEDSASPSSGDRPPDGSETNSSCCPRSLEDGVGSCGPHLASGAGEGTGKGAMPGCRELHGCLKPGTRGPADAFADSSASGGSHEESSERGELHQGHPSKKSRAVTSWGATQGGRPGSPAVSPSSVRKEGPRAEARGQGARHPRAASGEDAGGPSPPSACASAPGRSGKQESRASGLSSPGVSVLSRGSQRGRPRQHHHPKDSHCPLGLPASRPGPGPPSRGRARPDSPAPGPSGSPHSPRSRASRQPGPSFSASLPSRDTRGRSSVLITPVSNSDCVCNSHSPNSPAAEAEGDSEFRAWSAAPTPSNTSVSFNSQADGPGGRAGGDSPEPSWPSVLPVGWPEGGGPGAPRDSGCPQLRTSPALGPPGGKTRSLPASPSWGGQGPFSEACLVCSRRRPVPGKPRPSGKKRPLCTLSHGEGNPSADREPGGAEAGEGELDAWHPRPPGSPGGALGRAVRAARRGGSHRGAKLARTRQEEVSGGGGGPEEQEEGGCVTLGALPRASPGAVVRAWLSNIPEGPVKYEMADEGGDTAGRSPEGPEGDPVDRHAPDGPEGSVRARQLPPEGAAGEDAEPDAPPPVTGSSAGPKSGEGLPCSGVPEAPTEAGKGKGAAVDRATGQGVLPRRVSSSVHIMKALMGSRPGRPSSVPEVSSSAGRRLGRSAQALITCLARLRFLDDDLGSPAGKVRFTDSPRYQELLSTFQALWPGSGLGHRELDSGLQELGWGQALPALGSHAAAEDFTPTSSSGVDVGSGSGGSGEGHGPCTVDCALVPERMGLPSGIPCQRPDSRISGNPEDPGNQQPSGSKAGGASSEDKAEGNSGGQMLGDDLDQGVKNTMQEEGAQSEEIKEEKEGAEVQEEAVRGFPEEEGVTGRELSGAGSQDGAGAREDKSLQGEEGDPTSATLSPPGKRESPTERPGSLGESDPDASGSQGGPDAEPSLEKLSTAAETGCGQTQAQLTQGAEERGTSTARRGPLDPDPLWASKLLKKMEKAFMAHLATATAELQARWGLESNELLDRMVAELRQDVGRRLRDSIEQELREVQSRAGGTAPGPPREALRWETPLQAKQHRRHLQGLSDLSAFSEHTRGRGPPSFSLGDVPTFRGALGTRLGEQAEEEEFCPCEACVRKKVVPASPRDAVRAAGGPVREVFDLQQILQKKKGRCADGETAEAAPAKRGMEPLERDPSGTDPVRAADGGPELGSGQGPGVGEGDETLSRDEAPRGAEERATAEKRGRETDPFVGSYPDGAGRGEQGVGREDGDPEVGSGAEDTGPGEAPGGGDPSPGGHNAGAEAQGAEGRQQPESGGGNQGKREARPQLGLGHRQSREASRISSPDQEGRRTPSVAPGADSPRQRPGLKSGLSCSSISSLGNRSQLSQKSSEDEPSDRHTRSTEDEAKGVPDPETKVIDTWPESSPAEQEGAPSGSRTPERGTDEGLTPEQGTEGGSDLEAEKVVKSLASTEVMLKSLPMDGTDGFGQDDLDF